MDDYKTTVTLLIDDGEVVSHTRYDMTAYFHILIFGVLKIIKPVVKSRCASGSITIDIEREKVTLSPSLNPQISEIEVQDEFNKYSQGMD